MVLLLKQILSNDLVIQPKKKHWWNDDCVLVSKTIMNNKFMNVHFTSVPHTAV